MSYLVTPLEMKVQSWIFGTLTEVDQFLPTLARILVVVFQTSDFVLHWKK